jgi:hypothetical protein
MKTIDNYINERLNPRHLGSNSIDDLHIKGTACWTNRDNAPFLIVIAEDWHVHAWNDHGSNILLFWSPNNDWMPYLRCDSKPKDYPSWNFTSVYRRTDSRTPKDIEKNFHTWVRKNAGYENLDNVNISMDIKEIVDKWIKTL